MHAHERRRFWTDGGGVVGEASAIRRTNFLQLHAPLPEHVGQTKRTTDLDKLAATDDDLPSGGQ